MSEDNTKELTPNQILEMMAADVRMLVADMREVKDRLGAVESGLSALQATVDDRLKDTRPIWQAINARTERIEGEIAEARKELRAVDRKFDVFNKEMLGMKADLRDFDERLTKSEQRPN